MGNLVIGKPSFLPCTPYGIQQLLLKSGIQIEGKHVVVVGRSNIVGKPVALILLQKAQDANATVTVCHSRSGDLSYYTRQADILIAAIGRAEMIKKDMIKEGAVVIDVGVNRVDDPSAERGYKLVGDVDFDQVKEIITKIIRKLDTITVVVNCSTSNIPSIKIKDLKWSIIQEHFDINIKGSFNIIKCVLPIMENNKYGKIINITTQAIEKPTSEWLHYITAKSALYGFTKALAFELAPKGIRINLVSPGMTDTELIANVPEKVRLLTAAQTPLRHIATPEDIAGAISFLASDKSDFLTGETIRINGGQVMI